MTDNDIKREPHWHCGLCGYNSPLGESICQNPSCRAELSIYGTVVMPQEEPQKPEESQEDINKNTNGTADSGTDDDRKVPDENLWGDVQKEDEHSGNRQSKEELRRAKAAEKAQRKEAKRQEKRAKAPADRQKGKRKSRVLILVFSALLVLAAAIGAYFYLTQGEEAHFGVIDKPQQGLFPELGGDESQQDPEEPQEPEEPSGRWQDNVMMSDDNGNYSDAGEAPVFGTDIKRGEISYIFFFDTLADAPGDAWDISQEQNGSVLAWVGGYGNDELYIAGEGGVAAPEICDGLFSGYTQVEEIVFNNAFHTDNVMFMEDMFSACSSLVYIDLSSFDTSSVTDMESMFSGCIALETIDLATFDTSSVTEMRSMFYNCPSLKNIDVEGFDTGEVTYASNMFNGCASLSELDLNGWDVSQITNMDFMFYECSGLTSLGIEDWDTSSATSMRFMFDSCTQLLSLDLSGWDTSNVTSMCFMFDDCQSLTELNLSNWDTSSVTDMAYMFDHCQSLTELDVTSFDTSNVTDMKGMFSNCSGLSELNLGSFNTSNVTDMSWMFYGISDSFTLYYDSSIFDTSNVIAYENFMPDSFDWLHLFEE